MWGIKINPELAAVRGKILFPAQIVDNSNQILEFTDYEQRKVEHNQPINLKKETWALVYCNNDFDTANMLYEGLSKVATQFGIKIDEPQYIECPSDTRAEDFI